MHTQMVGLSHLSVIKGWNALGGQGHCILLPLMSLAVRLFQSFSHASDDLYRYPITARSLRIPRQCFILQMWELCHALHLPLAGMRQEIMLGRRQTVYFARLHTVSKINKKVAYSSSPASTASKAA